MAMKRKTVESDSSVFSSVESCAEEIGVSPRHLRTQIKLGLFPHVRLGNRIILPRKAVLDFLNDTAALKRRGRASARG